jgi:hypothetical protein
MEEPTQPLDHGPERDTVVDLGQDRGQSAATALRCKLSASSSSDAAASFAVTAHLPPGGRLYDGEDRPSRHVP